MTDPIQHLRERLAKATPGPLSLNEYGDIKAPGISRHDKLSVLGVSMPCGTVRKNDIGHANRDLIVAAINALPALLAVAEAAREAIRDNDQNADPYGGADLTNLEYALAKLDEVKQP